ncbi:AG2 protein OS=Streptomyces glaucescens OX=1907 GN=SGLAU_20105 PE=4 SV=1 [Streptomyces glaucescens]
MPTYHEIMTADLSALTAAAKSWDGMAGEFAKQEKAYEREVHGISMGTTWAGLSADAANARFDITLKQFQYAQTEAEAVAGLLRDAHTQFVELRGRLKTARQEAVDAGMKVSDQGFVSLDIERMSEAERRAVHHDPGYREAVQSWQDRINKAVQDVTDADAGVRIALQAVVIDESVIAGVRGFNGEAQSDVEKYEGQAAEEALKKLGRGDRLTDKELAELRRTFRDNGDDPAFSRTLLHGLGVTGTIKLTNELNDLIHVQGGDRVRDYSTIETGLANALASATRDTKSPWYEDWREDMRKAGVERHATDVQGARLDKAVGYQSLVTLMQKGHGYAPEMLGDLTDDMIAAEKKDPGIWQLKHEYAGKGNGWFANDPVDGMLGIMSRDPDAAARYLSSEDKMTYLVKERDWDVTLHEHEGPKASTYTPGEDADTRAGFGAALQAAATGIDPSDENARYVEHSERNDAVFKSAITLFADSGDDFPPSLREPMANVLINHGETVHRSMSSIAIAESPIDQTDLFEVSKQISKDSDAYSTLNGGLNQAMVADIHDDGPKGSTESLDRAGRTIGFLEEARVQAAGDPEKPEVEGKALVDRAISHIPVISSDVQAGFDYVTEKWLEDEQRRLEDQTTAQNIAEYTSRNGQLMALAREWQATHESPPRDPYDIQKQINESTEDGIKHAQGVSGKSAT